MHSILGLWRSLRSLKGNQRACVIAEPLWSVPYNLFLPFASVYMAALGLTDAQIGAIASLSLAAQFLWGLVSGAIIDRFGRRSTMLLFSVISWTIPCALWAVAKNPWHFAVAAAFNGMWRVTGNCFSCMIVEEEDLGQLVQVYTILNILGLAAGFLAPLAGLAIGRFSIVPTMRALYVLALALMTAKFLLLYRMSRESRIGRRRIEETKGQSLIRLAFGGWPAFTAALKKRRTRLCVVLMVLYTCYCTIQASFWPLFAKAGYGVSDAGLSAFPPVRTVVSLVVYLLITGRIDLSRIRRPLLLGIGAQGVGLALPMLFLPMAGHALWAVFLSAACDAFALAMLGPLSESLMSLSIPGEERARINSLIIAGILLVSAPAGWIAGQLAGLSRALPLALNLCMVAAEATVALWIAGEDRRAQAMSGI